MERKKGGQIGNKNAVGNRGGGAPFGNKNAVGHAPSVPAKNAKVYEILLIDDPMELHQHLEIFLRYVGGQHGSV